MVALVGVICHLLGYTVLWASVRGIITPSYPALIINGLVLCNGPSWTDTVSNVVSIQNFPGHRGPVSGMPHPLVLLHHTQTPDIGINAHRALPP